MTKRQNGQQVLVGVQVGRLRITALCLDSSLRQLGKSKRSTKIDRGPQGVARRIVRTVLDAVDEADAGPEHLMSVGVALAADFHPGETSPRRPWPAAWKRASLFAELKKQLSVPFSLAPLGAAAVFGVQEEVSNCSRLAAVVFEEELSGGVICDGELQPDYDEKVLGQDRWLSWGEPMHNLPGKKRYRKLANLLAKKDRDAMELFASIVAQLSRVLVRTIDAYQPERIALVGLGAEELKGEVLEALATTRQLSGLLKKVPLEVPASSTIACQLGAADLALREGRASMSKEGSVSSGQ